MREDVWEVIDPPEPEPVGTIRWTLGHSLDSGQLVDVEFVKVGADEWQFTGRYFLRYEG